MGHSTVRWRLRFSWWELFLVPVVLYLAFLAVPFGHRIQASLDFPYQLDGEEGFLLNQALRLKQGQAIYKPLNEYPYLVGNYPPLYIALCSLLAPEQEPTLSPGRFISIICSIGTAILLVAIVLALTSRVTAALLSGLLFFVTYANYYWLVLYRVDYLALLFSTAGLGVYLLWGEKTKGRWVTIILFVLAFYSRQTALCGLLAYSVAELLRRRERFLLWASLPWLITLGLFTILVLITRGQYFLHTVYYNANIVEWWQLKTLMKHFWLLNHFWLLALVGVVLASFALPKKSGQERRFGFLEVYLILNLLSLLTVGKQGATVNYFLEPYAAMALFVAVSLSRQLAAVSKQQSASSRKRLGIVVFALIALVLLMHSHDLWKKRFILYSPYTPVSWEMAPRDALVNLIKQRGGEVISEHPLLILKAGGEVIYQPFIMQQLAKEGKWDGKKFVEDLRQGRFSTILTTQDIFAEQFFFRWTPAMIAAMKESYESYPYRSFRDGMRFFVYVPKGSGE